MSADYDGEEGMIKHRANLNRKARRELASVLRRSKKRGSNFTKSKKRK